MENLSALPKQVEVLARLKAGPAFCKTLPNKILQSKKSLKLVLDVVFSRTMPKQKKLCGEDMP